MEKKISPLTEGVVKSLVKAADKPGTRTVAPIAPPPPSVFKRPESNSSNENLTSE